MEPRTRDAHVRSTLWLTGGANLAVFVIKLWVGLATGSLSIMGDAAHSLTDLANNAIALLVLRVASSPPDVDHPYGHRKYETLAVFGLATLLTVLAFEIGSRAMTGEREPPIVDNLSLALMLGVLVINIGVTSWEGYLARKLRSPLLAADAQHTFSDVLVTLAVIAGWQGAAHGYPWLDQVTAVAVALLVFVIAYRLFQRAVPVLVDAVAVEPERLHELVRGVPGVLAVRHARSRWIGNHAAIDVTIAVSPQLSMVDAHQIADHVEELVERELETHDITVHVEPASEEELNGTARKSLEPALPR